MRMRFLGVVAAGAALGLFTDVRDARACGGCFHAQTDKSTSFVSDHRMVVSISTKQTVLWDQVRFTGSPSEFAWVLPVRDGTRIELARDEWIQALDTATQPSVKGPDVACGGSGGGGVGCGSMSDSALSSSGASNTDYADDAGYHGFAGVEVVNQEVVGPYDAVTVRSSKGEAIHMWLRLNDFAVPDAILPILQQYTGEGFDFLALRLRPNQGVRSMRPVRVVMPGATPTLPLRMVAAGIGAKVGITLFVVSEGRYHPRNFPDATIDKSALAWDPATSRSNYRELVEAALAANGGRGWVTEYAGRPFSSKPTMTPGTNSYGIEGSNLTQPLDVFYRSACDRLPPEEVPCEDAGSFVRDAGASFANDAAADAAADADAGMPEASVDAATEPPPSACTRRQSACETFDDDTVALTGLHRSDVWVTRLRAELSGAECAAGDLELEPSPDRDALPATLKTEKFTDPKFDPCANADTGGGSCACRTTARRVDVVPALLAALGVASILRTRRRRR